MKILKALALILILASVAWGANVYGPGANSLGTANVCYTPVSCQSGTTVGVNGTVNETTLANSCVVGGNTLGANGSIEIWTLWEFTNAATTKTAKVKFGTAVPFSGTFTTSGALQQVTVIRNAAATNAQFSHASGNVGVGSDTSVPFTSTIDTTQNQTITITGQTQLEAGFQSTAVVGAAGTCTATKATHGLNSNEYVQVSSGGNCPTSGNPNADPVQITVTDVNTFTYACTCVGTEAGTQPTIKRYSVNKLRGWAVKVCPAN